jgi:hypothetical protein
MLTPAEQQQHGVEVGGGSVLPTEAAGDPTADALGVQEAVETGVSAAAAAAAAGGGGGGYSSAVVTGDKGGQHGAVNNEQEAA